MAATTSGYGAYNPAAVDPYPIESDLAKLAVGNSPENAANLLDLYQLQRTTDAANYGHEMGIQHDFARQQLAQQLKETYLKNALDAAKTRGGTSIFNQLAPESAINPQLTSAIETGLSDAQAATTAEHAASAAKHGLEAGFSTDLPRLTGMSSGLLTGQVTPLSLQLQAARNAGHGGGGGGGKSPFGFTSGPQEQLGGGNVTGLKALPGETLPQAAQRWRQQYGVDIPEPVPLPNRGDSAAPGTAPTGSPPAAPPRGKTSLAPAPQAPTRVQSSGQGGGDAQQAGNAWVENRTKINNPPAYKDIMAGARNGNVQMTKGADGRLKFKGKSGAEYDG